MTRSSLPTSHGRWTDRPRGPRDRRASAGLCLLALFFVGCERMEGDNSNDDAADRGEPTPQTSPVSTEAKLAMYLRCQDSLVDLMEASWARLAAQVDERGRVRRRRLFVYAVPRSAFRACNQTLREGPPLAGPMPAIESSAEAMVEAATEFGELTRELERYLDNGGLEQDQGAKVQVLYPLIARAYERWEKSDRILSLNLHAAKVSNDPELLAQLAASGHDVEYHARAVIIGARSLARCATAPPEERGPCGDELRGFQRAFDAFEAFYAAERGRADEVFWMRTYAEDAGDFARLVGGLESQLDDDTGLREKDAVALRDAYRRLFRGANTLDFGFPDR